MHNNFNMKKISIWLSIIILACFAIATLLFYQIDLKNYKDNKNQYDVNEENYFVTEEIKEININSLSSDINIIEYDATKVKVHIYGKLYNKNKVNSPVIGFNNGILDIKENGNANKHFGISLNIGRLFQNTEMKIDLYIPKGYGENIIIDSSSGNVKADPLILKELDINTFSGKIELSDVTADTVSLETSSGNINAENIQADDIKINSFSGNNNFKLLKAEKVYFENSSGNISLGTVEAKNIIGETFSGNIAAEGVKSDDVDMNTSSGKIIIEDATVEKVKCETFSGDVTFNKAALKDTEIDTSSGNVAIRLIEDSEFALEAESTSGNVSCEFPISKIEEQNEHEIKGVIGKDTSKIIVDTFSGDIQINK